MSVHWVFLDRDGTINSKPATGDYVTTPAQIELLPGAADAIRRLNEAGMWVGIATNQRGVALGRMSLEDLEAVHDRLLAELAEMGAHVDRVYACPHEQGTCACRKPLPGMLAQAAQDLGGIDFAQTAVIGDSLSDVEAGRSVGATTILLSTETIGGTEAHNAPRPAEGVVEADHISASLAEAVDWLLG